MNYTVSFKYSLLRLCGRDCSTGYLSSASFASEEVRPLLSGNASSEYDAKIILDGQCNIDLERGGSFSIVGKDHGSFAHVKRGSDGI